jgi:hypothetical protein
MQDEFIVWNDNPRGQRLSDVQQRRKRKANYEEPEERGTSAAGPVDQLKRAQRAAAAPRLRESLGRRRG